MKAPSYFFECLWGASGGLMIMSAACQTRIGAQ